MQSKDKNIYSVIDLGTNTCLLLTAKLEKDTLTKLYEAQEIPRLGKDLYKTGMISQESFQSVLNIFKKYNTVSIEYGSEKIFAFGTSAMRDAKNNKEFTDFIEKGTGIRIRIINGDEEAKYSYEGAVYDLDKGKEYSVLDIGGGSTEICYKDRDKIFSVSFDMGAVRLFEDNLKKEMNRYILENLKISIRNKLNSVDLKSGNRELVGVAGTITTLSAIKNGLKKFNEQVIHKDILLISEIKDIFDKLTAMTAEERLGIGEFMKGRNDIILPGALILIETMKYLNADQITVSAKGLRYGLLLNISDFNNS
jgi:exopolyphosphatase/guanosine-5'-triphosphate,3'-diphosphate pyrophosphatase